MILTACCKAVFRPFAKPKTILVMKLTTMLLLVGCLQVSAAGFAQKVSLNVENTSLKKVFKDIRRQTGYLFFYNTQLLEKAHPVSISANDREMKDVLDECFRDQPLDYYLQGSTIFVIRKVLSPTGEEQAVPPLQAQLKTRTGKVVYSWTIAPPARSLPPGASASFNSAEVNVPPGGDELTITLGAKNG